MADHTASDKFLDLLLPYLDHKNPKLRGKAGGAAALTVVRMQVRCAVPPLCACTADPGITFVCDRTASREAMADCRQFCQVHLL